MFVKDNISLPLYTKICTYIYILFQKSVVHTKLDIYFFNYFLNGEYFFINRTFQQLCLLQFYSSILKITYWNIIKWFICTDVVFHKSKKNNKNKYIEYCYFLIIIKFSSHILSWKLHFFKLRIDLKFFSVHEKNPQKCGIHCVTREQVTQGCVPHFWVYFEWTEQKIVINPYKLIPN